MSRQSLSLAAALLGLLAGAMGQAASSEGAHADVPGSLSVTGEGSLVAEYDMAKVSMSLTIKTRGKDTASLAQSKSQELTGAFIAALTLELGIPKHNITTTNANLHPEVEYKSGHSRVLGYSCSLTIEVDVATMDKALVPSVYALASRFERDSTEMSVHGLRPYVSEMKRKQCFEDLFRLAMTDAKFKANLFALGAERALGKVLVISDEPIHSIDLSPEPSVPSMRSMRRMARAETMMMDDGQMGTNLAEFPLGKGQKLTQTIHLKYQLL
mmetsp:Transcript_14604/g.36961  ORF Transcript_14604/g.36961 Transcript_14604/m.36961 type:complete len:270 (+) Transcript_14604:1611-2420(+)